MKNTDTEIKDIKKRYAVDEDAELIPWYEVDKMLKEFAETIRTETLNENIKLKSDIARAIGHMQGCGHPDKYLEKTYPEFKEDTK